MAPIFPQTHPLVTTEPSQPPFPACSQSEEEKQVFQRPRSATGLNFAHYESCLVTRLTFANYYTELPGELIFIFASPCRQTLSL